MVLMEMAWFLRVDKANKAQASLEALASFAVALALVTLLAMPLAQLFLGMNQARERLESRAVLSENLLLATAYSLDGWHLSRNFTTLAGASMGDRSISFMNDSQALFSDSGPATIELVGGRDD